MRTSADKRRRLGTIFATTLVAVGFATAAFADDLVTDADLATVGAQHSKAVSASPGETKTFAVDLWIECASRNAHMGASVTLSYSPGASTVPAGGSLGATQVTIPRPTGWPSDGAQCPSSSLRTPAQSTTVTITAPPSAGTYSYVLQFSSSDSDVTTNSNDSRVTITLSVVGKLSQTITFPPIADKTYGDPDFAPGASASSGLPVSYAASGSCTMSGGNVSLLAAGSCTVTASQAGNATYDPAPDVARSFTIAKAGQTITFDQPASPQVYDSSFAVSASASSGLGVSIVASGVCIYNGMTGLVTMTSGTGTCTLTASQAGSAKYAAAADVVRSVTAAKAGQSITFFAPGPTYGDPDSPLGATASSGLPVSYESATPGVCTIVGGNLHVVSAGTCSVTARQGGDDNYLAAADVTRTFSIAKAHASLALSGLSRTYNGSPQGAVVDTTPAGLSGVSVTYDGSAGEPTDAGSYAVVASLSNSNYEALDATGTLEIGRLTVTGSFTVAGKVYDGNASAAVLTRSVEGAVPGDDVALTGGAASFADRNAGEDKVVTLTGASLSGSDAHNYLLGSVQTATADIEPKAVTGSFDAADKVYDGSAYATITARSLSGGVAGDDVSLSGGSAAFDDKNVGDDKPVTGSGFTLAGADKDNYALGSVPATSADITPLEISGSFTAADKVYDGTTAASITGRSVAGAVAGDDVSLAGGSASFADKNVGDDKPVTGTGFTLAGADKGNYTLAPVAATSASITPLEVTGSFTAANKVYDGSDAATIDSRQLAGAIAGDDVSLTGGSATFADANAGDGKLVTGTAFSLAGADKDNYSLASSTLTTTADIARKPVTGSFEAADKVYDGTSAATITGRSLSGGLAGDDVSLSGGAASFADKNVGTDKAVTGSGFTLAGNHAGNYRLDSVSGTTADISPLEVHGSFTAADKTYDGTTAATITGRSLSGAIAGDNVSLAGGSASFADKNAGDDKPVGGSGFTLAGGDKGNYTLAPVPNTSADITKASLTVTAQDKQKLLGAPNPAFTVAYAGFVGGEGPAVLGGSLAFSTSVPSPEAVGGYDIVPSGLTSSNYAITFAKGKLSILYRWDGFLQPINDTAHQIGVAESKFKLGSTVPVKFQLKDAAGNAVQSSSLPVFSRSARIGACDPSTLAESVFNDPAFTDTAYRWSQPQYIYNWSTKGLAAGEYRVWASFDDGTKRSVDICLQ